MIIKYKGEKMSVQRNNTIYLEIEQFENYELTNNIAYEMAIRKDKHFLQNDSLDMNESHVTFIDKMGASEKVTFKGQAIMEDISRDHITKEDILTGLAYHIDFSPNKPDSSKQAYISATINTKRPNMISHVGGLAKIVHSSFNMALDIEELIAQITIIKKEFNFYQDDISSTAQYLGNELEKADKLICNSNKKCINPRKVLTKQEKLADMFFIYDCMNANITKAKICRMLDDYYYDKRTKSTSTDIKTVTEYHKIAIKYIDEMGYKELLTGVKNK